MPSDCLHACNCSACACSSGGSGSPQDKNVINRLKAENEKLLAENKALKEKIERLSISQEEIIDKLAMALKKMG